MTTFKQKWEQAVTELTRRGMTEKAAARKLAKENPGLRKAMLIEANQTRPNAVRQLTA